MVSNDVVFDKRSSIIHNEKYVILVNSAGAYPGGLWGPRPPQVTKGAPKKERKEGKKRGKRGKKGKKRMKID